MAEHRILTRVPSHEVINADLVVEVRRDGELLGELLVSQRPACEPGDDVVA